MCNKIRNTSILFLISKIKTDVSRIFHIIKDYFIIAFMLNINVSIWQAYQLQLDVLVSICYYIANESAKSIFS